MTISDWNEIRAVNGVEAKLETQINRDAFREHLADEYRELFLTDPEYAYSASITTPAELARKMTEALYNNSGNKAGKGIERTCKHFKIGHTYRSIRAFLLAQ